MALEEFWRNVRRAARLIRPPNVVADSPRISVDEITERLGTDDLWITRGAVAGYVEADFAFLSPAERDRLTKAVAQFLIVANGLDPRQKVTSAQFEQALHPFVQIVEMLAFDRYGDAEAFRIGKEVEQKLAANWSPYLDHLRFRTGLDSTDDPALWVWVFVTETGEYDDATFLARADVIEDVLRPVAWSVAPEGRVYLHFRTTSDLLDTQGVPA